MARRDHVQFPWESEGWATVEFRAGRDPELDRVVRESLRGAPSLYGVRQYRIPVNPYAGVAWATAFGALAALLVSLSMEGGPPWWIGGILGAIGLMLLVVSARMIPGWHRARTAAREYTAVRGIPFPRELRWYG